MPRPTRRTNTTQGRDSINNMMVKNLLTGRGDFVRQLQMVGFRFDNMLDEVSAGNMYSAEGHEVVRHSVWKWSHQAQTPQGVGVWWDQLNKVLLTTPDDQRSSLLSQLFTQASEVAVSSASKSFSCFAKTWDESEKWFGLAQGWTVKTRDNLVFSILPKWGDSAQPFVDEMWNSNRWTESYFQRDHFLKAWQETSELAVSRAYPELLSSLLSKLPVTSILKLTISGQSATEYAWQAWLDEHNRPHALSMQDEHFLRQTEVLVTLLQRTPRWSKALKESLHAHLPAIQKNPEWSTLSALIEQQLLGQVLTESQTLKNKPHRI